MIRLRVAAVMLLVGVGCADEPAPPASIVSVGKIPAVQVPTGGSATVVVPIVIADGYHVQANPAATEFLVPLELQIEEADGVQPGDPRYPESTRHRLEGADDDLLTYEGTVRIEVPVTAPPSISNGAKRLQGTVRYQACDARMCLFPTSVPVTFTVRVSG